MLIFNYIIAHLIFILIHCFNPISKLTSMILSSSIGYYNYRQTANSIQIYKHLKNNNLKDSHIILSIPQNSGCCEKNPRYGTISFIDNNYQNINKDIQIDRFYSNMNVDDVVNNLRRKYHPFMLNKHRLPPSQNLFLYMTGHGGDYYFKIRQRNALLDEHFKFIFQEINQMHKYKKILLMADSCSASTPYETVDQKNFFFLASSSFDQKSQSYGFDSQLNCAKADDFSYYLSEILNEKNLQYDKLSIKQLHQYMSFDKLKVHSKFKSNGLNETQNLNDFMFKKKTVKKIKFIL